VCFGLYWNSCCLNQDFEPTYSSFWDGESLGHGVSALGVSYYHSQRISTLHFSSGTKHGNSATTCFGHEDLEGDLPVWGTSSAEKDLKKHIMCCSIDRSRRNLRRHTHL